MTTRCAWRILSIGIIIHIALMSCSSGRKDTKPLFSISIKATSHPNSPCKCNVRVVVQEIANSQVVFAPNLCIRTEEGQVSMEDPEGREFIMSIRLKKHGEEAEYHLVVKQKGKLLQESEGRCPVTKTVA